MQTSPTSDLSPKTKELLQTPSSYTSRAAKLIKKDELWKKTVDNYKNLGSKRQFSPQEGEEQRRSRVRCLSFGEFRSVDFLATE